MRLSLLSSGFEVLEHQSASESHEFYRGAADEVFFLFKYDFKIWETTQYSQINS